MDHMRDRYDCEDKRDLLERLVDFDHCGNTATERFTLRMEARDEIKRLRSQLRHMQIFDDQHRGKIATLESERDAARRALEHVRTADNMSCVWHIVEAAILSWKVG